MKFGYQGGFSNPSQTYTYFNEVIHVRLQQRRAEPADPGRSSNDATASIKIVRNLLPTSFYAQDQWTTQPADAAGRHPVRPPADQLPRIRSRRPGLHRLAPTEIVYPSRSTQGVNWDDVTPRMGAAYDLFGNGKTAVKFNLGKYMEAFTATNTDLDLNPLIRTTISTTRTWTDTNKDFVPNCDLVEHRTRTANAAAMDNKNLGKRSSTGPTTPTSSTG